MKHFLLLLLVVCCGCSSYDYRLKNLKQGSMRFEGLPKAVRQCLSDFPPEYLLEETNDSTGTWLYDDALVFVNPQDTANYEAVTVFNRFVHAWVDYTLLIDRRNNLSYRIDQGVPIPYIIYEHKVFIPNEYNVLGIEASFKSAVYTEYQLK
jgi:hypothetical protein